MINEKIDTKGTFELVQNNNEMINKKIQDIIELRRDKRISFEKDGKIDERIKTIFEMEIQKCIELYRCEFPNYQCQGKEEVSFKEGKKTADCYGGINGLQITFGMQKFIDEVIMPTIEGLGYSVDSEGVAYFSSKANNYHQQISGLRFSKNYVGSMRDQMDYFAYLFAKNGIDMDWVMDALPHEAMHIFGVTGGNPFLKEGTTEELTREVCEKYMMHMSPTSHSQEAEFVRKLEIIVGRDKVIASGMWNKGQDSTERYSDVAETFDRKLGLKPGAFFDFAKILDNYYTLTGNHKTDPNFYRDVYNLNLDELENGYQCFDGKGLSEQDKSILKEIRSLFEKLSLEYAMEINGFEDLMKPINEYVQDKKLDLPQHSVNYTRVLAMQNKELAVINELIKSPELDDYHNADSVKDMDLEL